MKKIPIVILCGGRGVLFDGFNSAIPKAMVRIAGELMLTHVIKSYVSYGFNNFIIATGGSGDLLESTFFSEKIVNNLKNEGEYKSLMLDNSNCKVKFVDTGIDTATGDRLYKVKTDLEKFEYFGVAYSDILSLVNLKQYFQGFLKMDTIGVLLGARFPVRFRVLGVRPGENLVRGFAETPVIQNEYINGGFYYFKNNLFDKIKNLPKNNLILEEDILENLVEKHQLSTYKYNGPWQCLDSARDITNLDVIIKKLNSAWKDRIK